MRRDIEAYLTRLAPHIYHRDIPSTRPLNIHDDPTFPTFAEMDEVLSQEATDRENGRQLFAAVGVANGTEYAEMMEIAWEAHWWDDESDTPFIYPINQSSLEGGMDPYPMTFFEGDEELVNSIFRW